MNKTVFSTDMSSLIYGSDHGQESDLLTICFLSKNESAYAHLRDKFLEHFEELP